MRAARKLDDESAGEKDALNRPTVVGAAPRRDGGTSRRQALCVAVLEDAIAGARRGGRRAGFGIS